MQVNPHFVIVSDGKKGHENQSIGLVEAMLRRVPGTYEITSSCGKFRPQAKPSAIIAAGHQTHRRLLALAIQYRCPSIVIMRPTLPAALFSYCLIPEHDLIGKKTSRNIIPTKGALNRIDETGVSKEDRGLILLGGPSKHFDWSEDTLVEAIQSITKTRQGLAWTLADSRRTPSSIREKLKALELSAPFISHESTPSSWLAEQLQRSQEVWTSPDSTSMIYEALTAGCRVGTLPLVARDTRLSRAHNRLAEENWVTSFVSMKALMPLPAPPKRLHETARCAELILAKI